MIEIKDVHKSFNGIPLLSGISFFIDRGEKVSLIGPGASGKSTIVKMMLGIVTPDSGSIRVMETDMVQSPESVRQKTLKKVGMAFQQGALFDYMTVQDNLSFAMANMTKFDQTEMDERITRLLATVKLPRTRTMYPFELSGGMQRRVGVARAMTTDPDFAILDEPTSGLDPVTSTIILNMINDLIDVSHGKSVMVVTSSVEIAIRFSERIILVNEGQIVADGPWKELIVNGPPWVQHFLGVRLIGIDIDYARELGLPEAFIKQHW